MLSSHHPTWGPAAPRLREPAPAPARAAPAESSAQRWLEAQAAGGMVSPARVQEEGAVVWAPALLVTRGRGRAWERVLALGRLLEQPRGQVRVPHL